MKSFVARAIAPAAIAALASACSQVKVSVPVMRPAEVNMAGYHSIAVGGLNGSGHELMAAALEEGLVKSERFQVVDREHLAQVMRELRLSASDLADPSKASALGKQVTANALIFGNVDERYKEDKSEESFSDKGGVRHVIHKLHGQARVVATLKVTDVATGALIVAKSFDEKREDSNTGVDEAPKAIDRDGLSKQARTTILNAFLHAIVPHKEILDASFFTHGDLPQLETGVGYAKRGDWKKAQETFNATIQDAERNPKISTQVLGKAYWNLALAYEYSGDYDKATALVDKAYQLTQDGDMLAEQDNIKRLQSDQRKLAEQIGQKFETTGGAVNASTNEVVREKK